VNLVDSLLNLGQRAYEIEWRQVQAEVTERLQLDGEAAAAALDPRRHPTYWCVPLLVGDYVGATPAAIREDLPPFLAGCVLRHFACDPHPPLSPRPDERLVALITEAYDANRLGGAQDRSFAARLTAKCRPWTVLLGVGTQAIRDEVGPVESYDDALRAIVRVYSCLQLVDDWHDRADDAARGHWNCWTDEPVTATLAVIEPLLTGARDSVAVLHAGLLRRALAAQLQDAVDDLADIVAGHPLGFLARRCGAGGKGMWRDFEVEGVSRGSTECISAFIAAQLAAIPAATVLAADTVRQLLSVQRSEGGWGYRADVPADCDSTAWVLIAAHEAGVRPTSHSSAAARRFMLEHAEAAGGFVTYLPRVRDHLSPGDRPGWFESEISVTASALLALLATGYDRRDHLHRIGDYLIAHRTGDLWTSYWWQGFGYPTMLACWALSRLDPTRYGAELDAASRALWSIRRSTGGWACTPGAADDPFSTALAMQTLITIGVGGEQLRASYELLLEQRLSTGGFRPGAAMLAPGAGADGADLVLHDAGNVTTAAAVAALHAVERTTASRG
jgi:Prenyltransferase and squalene oxidase repeat